LKILLKRQINFKIVKMHQRAFKNCMEGHSKSECISYMILNEIVKKTKVRVENFKKEKNINEIMLEAIRPLTPFSFENALKSKAVSFICEVKKASPSAGIIDREFSYLEIAKEYERSGASALSVLTEPDYFLGDLKFLSEIKEVTNIPVLQKDFIIDEYQIYQARTYNADAILIICSILSPLQVSRFIKIAEELGISALVETHDEEEINIALNSGAKIIGVNNRNLKTMQTDLNTTFSLRGKVPGDLIFVSESGIKTPEDIRRLSEINVSAVLVGEALMKNTNKQAALERLRG